MKIITGTVTDGRIVVEGAPCSDGEKITVLSHEGNETFRVSAEEKRELLQSMAEADHAEFVEGKRLLRSSTSRIETAAKMTAVCLFLSLLRRPVLDFSAQPSPPGEATLTVAQNRLFPSRGIVEICENFGLDLVVEELSFAWSHESQP